MKTFELKKGLDVPVTGEPRQIVEDAGPVEKVALIGDDYIGMKPTMEVVEGERVKTGQLLFVDKKTKGIRYTSPATGTVLSINRGAKRKFESVVIEIEEDEYISFLNLLMIEAPYDLITKLSEEEKLLYNMLKATLSSWASRLRIEKGVL